MTEPDDTDPLRDSELLKSLEQAAAEAKKRKAKSEWLVTFTTADGAQRFDQWRGWLPEIIALPLIKRVSFSVTEPPYAPPLLARKYRLKDFCWDKGQAWYDEVLP